jgi:hypothetical protein
MADLINDEEFWQRDRAVHAFAEAPSPLRRFQREHQIGRTQESHLPRALGG